MKRAVAISKFLKLAHTYVWNPETGEGVREKGGANRGPEIDRMNLACGSYLGAPWCATSMSEIGQRSLASVYMPPRTAACDVLLMWARRRRVLHTTPKPGDLFLVINAKDEDDATHVGVVETVSPQGIGTLEGNTNNDGSRDGWGFLARFRPLSKRLVYVRWADLIDDIDETIPDWSLVLGRSPNPPKLPVVFQEGRTWVDYTDLMGALYKDAEQRVGYNVNAGGPLWDGERLPSSIPVIKIDGQTYVGVRAAGTWLGLFTLVDDKQRVIQLVRPD